MPEILKMRNYCMKKSPRTVQVRGELVPVAGIEPARGISPMDFESTSSTNSNTPADIFLYTRISIPQNLEGYAGGM